MALFVRGFVGLMWYPLENVVAACYQSEIQGCLADSCERLQPISYRFSSHS